MIKTLALLLLLVITGCDGTMILDDSSNTTVECIKHPDGDVTCNEKE